MTHRKSVGLEDALRRIAKQARIMVQARETACDILDTASSLLIGKKYEPFKSGNLKGLYQITDVSIHPYDGAVTACGLKITQRGLGRQRWELGKIHFSRLS